MYSANSVYRANNGNSADSVNNVNLGECYASSDNTISIISY